MPCRRGRAAASDPTMSMSARRPRTVNACGGPGHGLPVHFDIISQGESTMDHGPLGSVFELFLNVQQRRHRWLNRLVWGAVISCVVAAVVLGMTDGSAR